MISYFLSLPSSNEWLDASVEFTHGWLAGWLLATTPLLCLLFLEKIIVAAQTGRVELNRERGGV